MNFAVLCVSDRCSRGLCQDKSGPLIKEKLTALGEEKSYLLVPDEKEEIEKALIFLCDEVMADIVLTTGGTGFAPRDVTPEATRSVIEKEAPGIAEAIRTKSLEITPKAMLSRAVSGIRKNSLIINLPGSPKAVAEALDFIIPVLPHAVEVLSGNTLNCASTYQAGGD